MEGMGTGQRWNSREKRGEEDGEDGGTRAEERRVGKERGKRIS